METSFNNPSGWVRLHRSLFNSYVGADPVRFYRYCDLLAMAAYDDSATVWTGTRQLRLSAGQFVASKSYLARRWGIPPTSAYDFTRMLVKRGFLTRSVVDGICVYTLIDPSEISDINTDRSIDHLTDRSSDHLNNCAAECCTSYPTKTPTTSPTAVPTTSPTGFPTQYKEVRNKKEEKENIYIERVRGARVP